MDFPAKREHAAEPPAGMLAALGLSAARYVGRNEFDYLVEVDGEAHVRGLAPDFTGLARVEARGVIVTSRAASGDYDYVSRFFAPAAGVNEDPVTGSAHVCLAPYWSAKLGRPELVGYQASPRGGIVRTHARGDRVGLGGQAVTVLAGELV
jgi:predicted PhzF superfamily epimerase YddE/YHI9